MAAIIPLDSNQLSTLVLLTRLSNNTRIRKMVEKHFGYRLMEAGSWITAEPVATDEKEAEHILAEQQVVCEECLAFKDQRCVPIPINDSSTTAGDRMIGARYGAGNIPPDCLLQKYGVTLVS